MWYKKNRSATGGFVLVQQGVHHMQNADEVRKTIIRAVEIAKPWLKFESVRASGAGSRVMFSDPRQRLQVYEEKLPDGEYHYTYFYLTPDGEVEAWDRRSDGGNDGWICEFVRVIPFEEIDLEKVKSTIRQRLRWTLEDTDIMTRAANGLKLALSQI
jgi:hypothetical protein